MTTLLGEAEPSPTSKAETYLARLEDQQKAFHALWPTNDTSHTIPDNVLDNERSGTLWKIIQTGTDESTETAGQF